MNNLTNYFIYFVVYGYMFLLFLKGYYPANETGILFLGFLIFMTLAYRFVGLIITDELNARRTEIYDKLESLLQQNYQALALLRDVYVTIAEYKDTARATLVSYLTDFAKDISTTFDTELAGNLNFHINNQLITVLRVQIGITQQYLQKAYLLSVSRLIENRLHRE